MSNEAFDTHPVFSKSRSSLFLYTDSKNYKITDTKIGQIDNRICTVLGYAIMFTLLCQNTSLFYAILSLALNVPLPRRCKNGYTTISSKSRDFNVLFGRLTSWTGCLPSTTWACPSTVRSGIKSKHVQRCVKKYPAKYIVAISTRTLLCLAIVGTMNILYEWLIRTTMMSLKAVSISRGPTCASTTCSIYFLHIYFNIFNIYLVGWHYSVM